MLLQNHKIAPQNCTSTLLITETRIAKKLPKTPKLFPEAASKLIQKAVQSYSPKLIPGVVPQSCAPKLFPERLRLCPPIRQNGSQKPFAAPECCAPPAIYYFFLRFIIFSCLIFTFLFLYFF
jgi:hypothetical protein